MAEITERREVRVRADAGTFVFAAEPEAGRLVIREERDTGDDEELCALTIADREELSGFLQGLRRVLGVDEGGSRAADGPADGRPSDREARSALPAAPARSPVADGRGDGDAALGDGDAARDEAAERREAVERARARGQTKAFAPWSRDEERRLLEAVEAGRDLDELAREHQRSRRALELRLERLRS